MTIVQGAGEVEKMQAFLQSEKVEVMAVKINKNKKDEIKLEFDVVYPPGVDKSELLAKLVEMEQVIVVSE